MFYIPITQGYPDQTLRIELDGVAFDIRVYYSSYDDLIKEIIDDGRNGKWYMEIKEGTATDDTASNIANDLVDVKNIALVPGADLFEPYAYEQLGSLFVTDGENLGELPDLDNMGGRYKLLYIPIAEQEETLRAIGYTNASL